MCLNLHITYLPIPKLHLFKKYYVASLFEASRFLIVIAKPGNLIGEKNTGLNLGGNFVSLTLIFWPLPSFLLPIFSPT